MRPASMLKVFRSIEEAADFGPSAITIGNFDGVHCGHRGILRRVRQVADKSGWKAAVLTFDPHPTKLVAPARAPKLMTTPEQRCRLMAEEGIEHCLILPFTKEIAGLSPEEFVSRILVGALDVRAVLVGGNFRFGHRQAGDTKVLQALAERYGFVAEAVPAVALRGETVSSSAIREHVEAGQMGLAWRMLGRPFSLEGAVVKGHGVGSRQTVPTLNLAPEFEVMPASGVYVTRTADLDSDRVWDSVTNIGFRPTFGGDDMLSIETFLLGGLKDEAPARIRLEFLRRLRDERKFSSPDELKIQIVRDVGAANGFFRRLTKWHNG